MGLNPPCSGSGEGAPPPAGCPGARGAVGRGWHHPSPFPAVPCQPSTGKGLAPTVPVCSGHQPWAGTGRNRQPAWLSAWGSWGHRRGGGQGAAPCGVHVLGVQNATGRVSADPTTPSASMDQSDPVPAPSTEQSDPVPAHGSAVAGGCARQVSGSARELRALCPSLLCLVLPVSAVA